MDLRNGGLSPVVVGYPAAASGILHGASELGKALFSLDLVISAEQKRLAVLVDVAGRAEGRVLCEVVEVCVPIYNPCLEDSVASGASFKGRKKSACRKSCCISTPKWKKVLNSSKLKSNTHKPVTETLRSVEQAQAVLGPEVDCCKVFQEPSDEISLVEGWPRKKFSALASVSVPLPLEPVFASVDREILSLEGKDEWETVDSQTSLAAGVEAGYPQHCVYWKWETVP